ncbi:hypothetical protein BH23ACT10_BH23ACT10_10560 [soil metagenome]
MSRSAHADWTFGPEVFDALPSPMALVAASGIVAEVNTAWCRLTGDTADADVGRPLWQRFSPAERSRLADLVERYSHEGERDRRPAIAGTQLRRSDGRCIDVALRLGTTSSGPGPRILLVQLEPFAEDRDRTMRRPPGTGDRQLALTTVARTVAAGGDLRRVAATVLTTVARATACPLVGLWRRGAARESLVLVDGVGFPTSAHGRLTLEDTPTGLARHTLRARSVVIIGGPSGTVADLPHALRDHGVASGAAVGIHGTAGADGLLTVCAGHNQPLPPESIRFLAIVGDLLSMALQRESIDDLIAAERQRTTATARDLEQLRRRHELTTEATQAIEWRWVAPTTVQVGARTSPPLRLPLAACLDGGPQAIVDATVDDDVEQIADVLNTCLRLSNDLECTARLHTIDGVTTVRLRGAVDRGPDGTVHEISGYAAIVAPTRVATPSAPDDRGSQREQLAHTAHDLNNLLAAILGTAEHLVDGAHDRRRLTAIVRAGRRARELVAGLGPDQPQTHPLAGAYELADVVEQLRPLLPGLVGPQVRLDYTLGRGARTSGLTRDEVERILLNLISNSRDAMRAGGTIRIAVDTCIQLEPQAATRSAPPVGSWARLAVGDDGAGMPAADRSRVFEPGFTTKRTAQHAGLGLASVRDSVAAAGGVIGVASTVGRGTTVSIYLPLAAQEPVRLQPLRPTGRTVEPIAAEPTRSGPTRAQPPQPQPAAHGVALLVDDEAAVRDLLATLLERLGFTVKVAADGERALEVADGIDDLALMVSDLRMPGIDGLTLGRRMRELHAGVAIILLTGAPPPAPIADRRLRVVRKPFDWETLRDAVRSLSDPPAATPALEPMYPAASG